jgi:16S rRNA (guanine527-N7)-methyltransferase
MPPSGAAEVSRETLDALSGRYGLPAGATGRLGALLGALAGEADPPTTVREPEQAVHVHVADSLSGLEVQPLREARRVADVGSGAGFPGLVVAIALPAARVDLIESARRKCAVIERLARAVGIENARAVAARAEQWGASHPPVGGREGYEVVCARALAPLAVLVEYAAPLLRDDGVLVAWKGARDAGEERAGEAAAELVGMAGEEVLEVKPFASARDRHLHVYRKVAPTPSGFPRRPGMAAKRPLGKENG